MSSRICRGFARLPRGPINRAVTSREPLAIQYGRPILTHCERTFIAGVPNGTTRSLLPLPITVNNDSSNLISEILIPTNSDKRIPQFKNKVIMLF